jgi:hypothetical protein
MRTGPIRSRAGLLIAGGLVGLGVLLASSPAGAVPAFARKYGTSCQTCHTVFPKLTPFGETFRRNGFRFPGVDSDAVAAGRTQALGPEAARHQFPDAVWPATLPTSAPLAFGLVGQARLHPDRNSAGARADHRAVLTLQDLAEEAQLWAAGSFTDATTFFAELSVSEDEAEIEHGFVWWSDLVGPRYALGLIAGKTMPQLTSFGPHSTYLADTALPPLSVAGLYGATSDTWSLTAPTGLVEASGVLGGRFDYSLGLSSGVNVDVRPSESTYAHVGYKLGGMALAGGAQAASTRPWEETAATADLFAFREVSRFDNALGDVQKETAWAFGGGLRLQWRSLELDAGAWGEVHEDAQTAGGDVTAFSHYSELSYVVWPWLVPALRVEYTHINPEGAAPTVSDLRVTPGVAALVFANLKLTLSALIERADGAPPAGWEPAGGQAAPPPGDTDSELEVVRLDIQWAI